MSETTSSTLDNLSLVQRWFHAVMTHPDGVTEGAASTAAREWLKDGPSELEGVLTASSKLGAADRLSVYANAYYARLVECLGEVYPMVRSVVEEDAFRDFAIDYLQTFPSKTYTLHTLGLRFVDYLRTVRPDRAEPSTLDWADFVIDLARLEWSIYDVFDGPGMEGQPTWSGETLLPVPPERWPQLCFQFAPCVRLLQFDFPVNEYFSALRAAPENTLPPLPDPHSSFLVLTRRDFVVRRFSVPRLQFDILSALLSGQSLGTALEAAFPNADPANPPQEERQLQAWFGLWSREGFITGCN